MSGQVLAVLTTLSEAQTVCYRSYQRALPLLAGRPDWETRQPQYGARLLTAAGYPCWQVPTVVVAGSKGKGSVAYMVARLLQEVGLRVGLFTSPHLVSFCERLRVNGRAIGEEAFLRLFNRLLPEIEVLEQNLLPGEYLGPVGISLAVALLFFQECNCQVNVLECGRGGLLDEVNLVPHQWSVLTPIWLEHRPQLGATIEAIASHKAGIIKPGQRAALMADQEPGVTSVIRRQAYRAGVPLLAMGRGFRLLSSLVDRWGTSANIVVGAREFSNLRLNFLGRHQAANATLALAAALEVAPHLSREQVALGLQNLHWPGRLEVMRYDPLVLLDGCIHRASALQALEVLEALLPQRVVAVVAIPQDKDYPGVLELVAPRASTVVLTQVPGSHFPYPDDAAALAGRWCSQVLELPGFEEALAEALRLAGAEGVVMVLGAQAAVSACQRFFHRSLEEI